MRAAHTALTAGRWLTAVCLYVVMAVGGASCQRKVVHRDRPMAAARPLRRPRIATGPQPCNPPMSVGLVNVTSAVIAALRSFPIDSLCPRCSIVVVDTVLSGLMGPNDQFTSESACMGILSTRELATLSRPGRTFEPQPQSEPRRGFMSIYVGIGSNKPPSAGGMVVTLVYGAVPDSGGSGGSGVATLQLVDERWQVVGWRYYPGLAVIG